MNIVVLAGGLSPERDVSLSSGAKVTGALRECGHNAVLVDLFFGPGPLPDPIERFFSDVNAPLPYNVGESAPDLDAIKRLRASGFAESIGENVIELCRVADITYLALHGGDGENGRLQAFFDQVGVRYTGSGYLASACAMHKWITKRLFTGAGIPTPHGVLIQKSAGRNDLSGLSLPLVVKPCCGGSSIGISIAFDEAALTNAIADAFCYEDEIIVEEYIPGREIAAGVLGGEALPLIEIIPRGAFYDYKHKYQPGWTQEITPAPISAADTLRIQKAACAACRALGTEVYARVDFLLRADGEFFCLEVNTLPGMTKTSLLPQEAAAAGLDYRALCDAIIQRSLRKYQQ